MSLSGDVLRDLDAFDDQVAFQRVFWRVERIAWVGFAVLLCLALSGLTGAGGPLAQARVATSFGSVELPRVARWQTPARMVVRFDAVAAQRAVRIDIDRAFFDAFDIEAIQPAPAAERITPEGMAYAFDAAGGGSVVFTIEARRPGLAPAARLRAEGDAVAVRPLVLP